MFKIEVVIVLVSCAAAVRVQTDAIATAELTGKNNVEPGVTKRQASGGTTFSDASDESRDSWIIEGWEDVLNFRNSVTDPIEVEGEEEDDLDFIEGLQELEQMKQELNGSEPESEKVRVYGVIQGLEDLARLTKELNGDTNDEETNQIVQRLEELARVQRELYGSIDGSDSGSIDGSDPGSQGSHSSERGCNDRDGINNDAVAAVSRSRSKSPEDSYGPGIGPANPHVVDPETLQVALEDLKTIQVDIKKQAGREEALKSSREQAVASKKKGVTNMMRFRGNSSRLRQLRSRFLQRAAISISTNVRTRSSTRSVVPVAPTENSVH